MMQQGKDDEIGSVRHRPHGLLGGLLIAPIGSFFGKQEIDERWPGKSNQYTSGSMQSGCLKKHIHQHSGCKTDEKQGCSSYFKWQPEDEYKVERRHDKLVQWRNLAQHKNLDEHDEQKPDDIFEE